MIAGRLFPPAAAFAADLPEVSDIDIEGVSAFDEGDVRDRMRTKTDSFWYPLRDASYRRDIVLEDLERIVAFYRDHGYRDARAELVSAERIDGGRKVAIRIRVMEGAQTLVASVDVSGVHVVKRETVFDELETESEDPYSATRVTLDRLRLLDLYADRGRPFTVIRDSVAFDSLRAHVQFLVEEGNAVRIRNILVEGPQETKSFVIRRELVMDRGDLLRRAQVIESRERLLETGLFRDVRFQPVPADSAQPPRIYDLKVTVVERQMGWVSAGVGYSSSEQVRLSSEVGQRNIFGNAKRLVGRARVAFDAGALFADEASIEETRADVTFFEPWLFSTRNEGTVTLFGQSEREIELPDAPGTRITREDALGFTLAAERRFGARQLLRRSRVRASFDNRWVDQEIEVGDRIPAEPDSTASFVARSVSFFFERDRRDSPFDPGRGTYSDVLVQVAGGALGGRSSFVKVTLAGSWYRALGSAVLATRLRGGVVLPFATPAGERAIDQVPREDRFRAGGATTVRGYPEDSLGPQTVTTGQNSAATDRGLVNLLGNVELRFPLRWRFAGAVFLDAGNVWEEARDVRIKDFVSHEDRIVDGKVQTSVRYSIGTGLRFQTPVGPLRLDYGYGLVRGLPEDVVDDIRGGEWHLSLGQAF